MDNDTIFFHWFQVETAGVVAVNRNHRCHDLVPVRDPHVVVPPDETAADHMTEPDADAPVPTVGATKALHRPEQASLPWRSRRPLRHSRRTRVCPRPLHNHHHHHRTVMGECSSMPLHHHLPTKALAGYTIPRRGASRTLSHPLLLDKYTYGPSRGGGS